MSDTFDFEQSEADETQPAIAATRERESAIYHVLRRAGAENGLSIRQIAERAKAYLLHGPKSFEAGAEEVSEEVSHEPKQDNVSIQAYHKMINRMVALGHIEEMPVTGEKSERLFRAVAFLHSANPLTLDDIYEYAFPGGASQLNPTESIARITYAQDYLGQQKDKALKEAAIALASEDPRDIFYSMLCNRADVLNRDAEIFADADLGDDEMRARVERGYDELRRMAYRSLGVPPEVINVTNTRKLLLAAVRGSGKANTPTPYVIVDHERLRQVLSIRIFGPTFLHQVDVSDSRGKPSRKRLVVSGSDGSTHASELQVRTAVHFSGDGGMVVTFNNAMGYVHQDATVRHRVRHPFYSVPITRTELDRPGNRGMIMARQMYRDLEDGDYLFMTHCATDVVQWRVDHEVFCGTARPMGMGSVPEGGYDLTLPQPSVHFRDGTVVPQEREFRHYNQPNAYGDMVREGQNKMRSLLERIRSDGNTQVFAGAVKTTQMMIFSQAVSWYISFGSKDRRGGNGEPIDAKWDANSAAAMSDNQTMTYLLAALTDASRPEAKAGKIWVTCVVSRPFHTTTEHFDRRDVETDEGWKAYFEAATIQAEHDAETGSSETYWAVHEWQSDSFAYLCRHADFAMFYIGHTGGNPPPGLPRYEFLDSIRTRPDGEINQRVMANVHRIVEAIDQTKVALDNDHNFMSAKKLIKIIPYVVLRAHEVCKSLGREWESELRAAVLRKLGLLQKYRGMVPADASLKPVMTKQYLEPIADALRKQEVDEPEHDVR